MLVSLSSLITPVIFVLKTWYHANSSSEWSSCSKLLGLITRVTKRNSLKWSSSTNRVLNISLDYSLDSRRICASTCWEKSIEYRDSRKIHASECNITFERYRTFCGIFLLHYAIMHIGYLSPCRRCNVTRKEKSNS